MEYLHWFFVYTRDLKFQSRLFGDKHHYVVGGPWLV